MAIRSLADPGQPNLITPLRGLLALAVAIPHVFLVPAGVALSPLANELVHGVAAAAVDGFFILSGFLIAKSLESRGDLVAYFLSRALRIFPALAALAFIATFIIGPALTTESPAAYFSSPAVWRFPFELTFFINADASLPGVFMDAANVRVSAPTWTLRYEAIAYLGAALAFAAGAWRGRTRALALAGTAALVFIAARLPGIAEETPFAAMALTRFGLAFAIGGAAYFWRARIVLRGSWVAGAAMVGTLALALGPPGAVLGQIALGYALLFGAYGYPRAARRLSRAPDLSYGLYIWHVPSMKIAVSFAPAIGPIGLLATGLPLAIGIAYLSWRFVESPALAAKPGVIAAARGALSRAAGRRSPDVAR